jgi:BirA family transcriptional regulator, biotin operon repressor / biotin---[acetyl-CoA-carboxylase] ligase
MLGQDSLELTVRAAGIDVPPVFLDVTGSTNLDARGLAEAGAPEWTVVVAGHQTAGRGRLGRRWDSAPGKALLVSVVLRPPLGPEDASVISLLVAAEMSAACRRVAGVEVTSEWPNDLVAGKRKVGGILTEAAVVEGKVEHVVIGVGVNVSMATEDFPDEIREIASSLQIEGGSADAAGLLEAFLVGFRNEYRPDAARFRRSVVERYRTVCTTLGRRVRATVTDGTLVEGTAVDLDDRGGLVVETERGRESVSFREIAHLE